MARLPTASPGILNMGDYANIREERLFHSSRVKLPFGRRSLS